MSWDEYDARTLREKVFSRIPLIIAGVVIVALMGSFVFLLAKFSGHDTARAALSGATNAARAGNAQHEPNRPIARTSTTIGKPETSPEDALHPKPTDADSNAAIAGATNFVKAWANPSLPQPQWLEGIKPFTSSDTIKNFQKVDPLNVPARAVTAPATVEAIGSLSASVLVPTDAGAMRVVLDSESKAQYIEPVNQPGSAGDR